MKNKLMIDLETLSTKYDAAVISIGAAVFDDEKVLETAYWPISFENPNGTIDIQTVVWWLNQSYGAQQATFADKNRVSPFLAASELSALVDRYHTDNFWCNDPHFDYVVLENWWRRNSLIASARSAGIATKWPFMYRQPRSYRTIIETAKDLGWTDQQYDSAKGMYTAHNAMEDAAAQARVVIAARQFILNHGGKR